MAILNYTTQIDFNKTIGEIYTILARAKVQQISTNYDKGLPTGIQFMILYLGQPMYFRLNCNTEGVYKKLCNAPKVPNKLRNKEQSLRVAWRIIKDWIEAQMAIVEVEQAHITEVFLPYVLDNQNQTMFERFTENQQKQLTSGKK